MSLKWEDIKKRIAEDEYKETVLAKKQEFSLGWAEYGKYAQKTSSAMDRSMKALRFDMKAWPESGNDVSNARRYLLSCLKTQTSDTKQFIAATQKCQRELRKEGGFSMERLREIQHMAKATVVTHDVFDAQFRMIISSEECAELKYRSQYHLQAIEDSETFLDPIRDKPEIDAGFVETEALKKCCEEYIAGGLQYQWLKLRRLERIQYAAQGYSLGVLAIQARILRFRAHAIGVRSRLNVISRVSLFMRKTVMWRRGH